MNWKPTGANLEDYFLSGMGVGILLGFLAYFLSKRFLTRVLKPKQRQYLGTIGMFLAAGVWISLINGKLDDPVHVFIAYLFGGVIGTYSLVTASFAGR